MDQSNPGRAGPLGPPGSPTRAKLPRGRPSWISSDAWSFISVCCQPRGANHLCHDPVASTIWESIVFRERRGDWNVSLCLLMPDHLHALILFPGRIDYVRAVSNWKEMVAKKTGIRWQRDFFDHRFRSTQSLQEKAAYIRLNPVRKGLVSNIADWKYVRQSFPGGPSGPALPEG